MARPQHYVFGHIALRQMFFHNPPAFVAALASRGEELLKQIWDDVGEKIDQAEGEAVQLPSQGLACSTHDIGSGAVAVIVSLPPPTEPPEAHFVGLVLRPPQTKPRGLLDTEKGIARYITLEHGINIIEGEERTVLCEWSGESHANMGDGPEATVPAFVHTLAEMVRTSSDV
jgi:hypothetical protein